MQKQEFVHPRLAQYRLRAARGVEPCTKRAAFDLWLQTNPAFSKVIETDGKRLCPLDLSVVSPALGDIAEYAELERLTYRIDQMMAAQQADIGYGGYLETRPLYTTEVFKEMGYDGPRWRSVHLGIDFWSPAGTAVFAPYAGRVHSFRQNNNPRDYGATLVLAHSFDLAGETREFYTLYGHLSAKSLDGLSVGRVVAAGDQIATFGQPHENGGWPPHLHFQVILDMLDREGDFAGVAFPEEAGVYGSICPDPGLLSGVELC
jgi:murein DD-endopeptidase MepM/ murein hydrolase activator NlpD